MRVDATRLCLCIVDLAKVSLHVLDPARFAPYLAVHLRPRYAHPNPAFMTLERLRWARIEAALSGRGEAVAGRKNALWRNGEEKRCVGIEVACKGGTETARWRRWPMACWTFSVRELPFIVTSFWWSTHAPSSDGFPRARWCHCYVIKSTGWVFGKVVGDEHATVVEVDDRIFTTSVDLRYAYGEVSVRLVLVIGISRVEGRDVNVMAGWR